MKPKNAQQPHEMISLGDYNGFLETVHLLRSPANARRLLAAIESLESGKGKVRKLARRFIAQLRNHY